MMRWFAFPVAVFLSASLWAQDELPKDPEQPLDIEPPLLIQEIPNKGPASFAPNVAPELDPERIQVALDKAKKSAAAGERLFRSGIIAKLDMENRGLKVMRLEADLANARAEMAKKEADSQEARFEAGEISEGELEDARSAVVAATNLAASAVAKRDKAELDEALLNLSRQKKLLALGSGRKSEVNRAEEKVTALQQHKD